MEMKGEQLIPAPQAETWAALNDPEVLKACIPGCESIERSSDTDFTVSMTARVGPVAAKFKGKMKLSDVRPPESYSIAFEGQGGIAGFAKGGAQVRLAPEGDGTKLSYTARANVGGKLAQIGSRLVDAAAQKVAGDFFAAFNAKVAAAHGGHGRSHAAGHDDEHHPAPIPRDPELPDLPPSTLAFFAAGALLVVAVSLMTLL
jgi:carbon monoxide dehydrogenase subunit G